MGQKPDLKVALKPKGEGERVYLLAFWRRENGKLSGDIDRKVRGLRVYLEDGSHVDVKRHLDGKLSHWLDAFEDDGAGGQRRPAPRDTYEGRGRAEPRDQFADDDLPF